MKNKSRKKNGKKFNIKMFTLFSGILLFIVLIIGVVTILLLSNKDDKLDNQDTSIPEEIGERCPYTLEEIYEKIETNWMFDENTKKDEAIELAYILFHFYDCFSEDTEFMVWETIDQNTGNPLTFRMINYQEYAERSKEFLSLAEDAISRGCSKYFYVIDFRSFMLDGIKLV